MADGAGPSSERGLREIVRFSRPTGLPGIEIMSVDNSTRLWRNFHEQYAICTVLDDGGGGAEWAYRGRNHFAQRSQLMLIEPGELHVTTRVLGAGTFRVLHISPSSMETL